MAAERVTPAQHTDPRLVLKAIARAYARRIVREEAWQLGLCSEDRGLMVEHLAAGIEAGLLSLDAVLEASLSGALPYTVGTHITVDLK